LTERLHQDIGFASRFYRAIALFLSSRLRVTLTELNLGQESVSPDLELSPVLLEEISLAQARFDWLLRRAQNAIHASQSS
jgi:hypothetical protein